MLGQRLSQLVSFEKIKLAAGVVILSPFLPLLFMGEEYGETSPFLYFTSHSDRALIEAVRRGRRAEFAAFEWQSESPDPQEESTFLRSKLHRDLVGEQQHRILREFYQELITLRRNTSALATLDKERMEVAGLESERVLEVRRWTETDQVFMIFNFDEKPVQCRIPASTACWRKALDSADERWLGKGTSIPESLKYGPSSGELGPSEQTIAVSGSSLIVFTQDCTERP